MKSELKSEFSLLKRFYTFFFIESLAGVFAAYIVIYFTELGFSFQQVSLIVAVSLIAPLIFEVPTGAVADQFGRRISIAIGLFAGGFLSLLIPSTNKFLFIIIILFSMSAFNTFSSGADAAYLVDFLKEKKRSKLIRPAFGRVASIGLMGNFFALLAASAIVKYLDMSYLWYVQGGALISAGFFIVFFGEPEKIKPAENIRTAMKDTFGFARQGFGLIFAQRTLFLLVLSAFFSAFFAIAGLVWQPFFQEINIPLENFGILFAGAAIIGAIGASSSNYFATILKSNKAALILNDLIIGSLFITISFVTSPLIAIMLFYGGVFGRSMTYPVKDAFLHKHIPSKIRATVDSIKSLVTSTGGVIALLIAGYIMDTYGIQVSFLVGGLAAIPTIICYMLIKEDAK
ncbi:MFS transporter [Candidatus Woesearchaeota archaeon]|jgi:MFS family permease|nr:MFS transporter [Candidatus Woesearchaeota archaeon]MBT4114309.1 MFS transporter [Candidatus Woesearchaeota archaeon]MBT4248453.1 MFS transporter [Candidatus Woesearchaeota archaeon]